MRALVTGSNGFIGSFLVEKLLREGIDVRCLVRRTSNLRWLEGLNLDLCYGELSDPASLAPAVRDVDYIFHLGGVTRGLVEQDYVQGNVVTTQNLLDACLNCGHDRQKFIFVSSQAAGGPSVDGKPLTEEHAHNPISMYGRSKYGAEQAVLKLSTMRPITIVRPPSVYGPRDSDFFTLFKNANIGFLPIVGGGRQKINIIHVADLVEGLYRAGIKDKSNGELFFLSSDEEVSFAELAQTIAGAMKREIRLMNIPLPMVRLIVAASTFASSITKKPSILNKDKYNEMRQPAWLCSNEKAKRLLDFQPTVSLKDGMRETAEWYKKQGWL